ncbi:MAG: MFS transporter [Solirubrobacterales bacterium]
MSRCFVPALVGVTLVVSTISSLGAPLVPSIADSLSVSLSSAQWSLTSALLAGAVAAPILGRLGDGPHRREAMLGALAVVTAGGLIAGAAGSLPVLVVGRSMQGVGLGMVPLAMAAARDHLPADRVAAVIGLLSVSGAAGLGAGYPISGLIAHHFDVHAAFVFGAAMSAGALLATYLFVPSSRGTRSARLDLPSAAIGAFGLIALLVGVAQGERWGWGSAAVLGCFALAAVVLTFWVQLQLRREMPLVDLRQLRHRAVLGADMAAMLLGLALYMFLSVVTEFVQTPPTEGFGFGATTLTAGLCLLPFSILSLLSSRVMSAMTRRIGTRAVLVFGAFAIFSSGVFCALVHDQLWQAFLTMGLLGIGFGFTFAAIPGLITRSIPAGEVGSAMGFYQVIRSIGYAVGSALVATVLAGHEVSGSDFPAESGYMSALWIGVAACVLAAAVAALLSPAGEGMPASEATADLLRDDAELASAGLIDAEVEPRR